jgi:DNA-binding transcriptional MerR regulator
VQEKLKTIYLVKDLASATGHTVYTIEHYLKKGLLKEISRGPHTNYRCFDESAVNRLLRIKEMRKRGESLNEIRLALG